MVEGLYSAAAGMMAQQERLDSVANDIANVNTHGYKHVRVAFRDLAYLPGGQGAADGVNPGSGSASWALGRSFAQGGLERTDRSLDVAIQGPGFMRVRTANGQEALTRDGNLQLDARGQLVTSNGNKLVPPITIPRGTDPDKVSIAPDGRVSANGRQLGRIQLFDVPAPDKLTALGDNLYAPSAGSGAPRAAGHNASLTQGALEASNVDMATAMVDMMDAQKSYALASRVIQMQDQAMEIANGLRR
jgi:flagellar basal-body rod protein FlgG